MNSYILNINITDFSCYHIHKPSWTKQCLLVDPTFIWKGPLQLLLFIFT